MREEDKVVIDKEMKKIVLYGYSEGRIFSLL